MDRLAQSFVDDVVHLAQVDHKFFLFGALEGPHFLEHGQEVGRAELARVKLAEKHEEGVPLLDQGRSELLWEAASHHVQNGPAHVPQFLPRNVVLALIYQFHLVLADLLLPELLPKGQHLGRQQLIPIEEPVFNNISSGIIPIEQKTGSHEDEDGHRYEAIPGPCLDLADDLIFDLVLVFEGGLEVVPIHRYYSKIMILTSSSLTMRQGR